MNPLIFGPKLWFVIHTSAVYYSNIPDEYEKKMMYNFIISLPILVPCSTCKQNLISWLIKNKESLPVALNNRTNLFIFFINLHNDVNKLLKKKEISLNEAKIIWNF